MDNKTAQEMIDYLRIRIVGKRHEIEKARKLQLTSEFTDRDKNKLLYDLCKYIAFAESEILNLKFIADF